MSTISGSCHCGAVSFELAQKPLQLVDCNCSICRRLGALWGHVPITAVTVQQQTDNTIAYVHGDKMLAFHTCKHCGCTTHWESLTADGEHMAVNFRMCQPETVAAFQIRKFDGAETWTYLDE